MLAWVLAAAITGFSLTPLPACALTKTSAARAHKAFLSTGKYARIGEVPAGVDCGATDLAKIEAMVEERAACRAAKDFGRADDIKELLRSLGYDDRPQWGVKVRDTERTWYVTARIKTRGSTVVERKASEQYLSSPGEQPPKAHSSLVAEPPTAQEKPVADAVVESLAPAPAPGPVPVLALAPVAPQGFEWGATF